MYNVTGQKPGDVTTKCIRLTYTGSLAATVKLYTSSTVNALGSYVDLSIDKGSMPAGAFPGCTGFTSEANIFSNTLANFTTNEELLRQRDLRLPRRADPVEPERHRGVPIHADAPEHQPGQRRGDRPDHGLP